MTVKRALGIIAKAPLPGTVKTRLCPPLDDEQAAFLASAFLRDVMLAGIQVQGCDVRVILSPGDDPAAVAALAPAGVSIAVQRASDLGAVQRGSIRDLLQQGAESVCLIGADLPELQPAVIQSAFDMLDTGQADLVIGPAIDGGYYLIAAAADHPRLFEDIAWSTESVLEQTLQRAGELGLSAELLSEMGDVDDAHDLERLVEVLGTRPEIEASATRAALQLLRSQGASLPQPPIPWKVTRQTVHFESNWRTFVEEETVTHTGDASGYSYVVAPDAVWIVPVTSDGRIVLVRQYRHPVREWVLEVPAGALDGLSPAEAAVEELREEIGGVASRLHNCGAVYGGSGSSTHRSNYFIAFEVELGETAHEATEVMEIMTVPAEIAFDMAARGEISDGQSALAILMARDVIRDQLG